MKTLYKKLTIALTLNTRSTIVVSKEEPLPLNYEYYKFGGSHEYFLRHCPYFSDAQTDSNYHPLEHNDLLLAATLIASGISYLNTHSFIQKIVLKARSCIIVKNIIINMTYILGISDMYAGDYYQIIGRLPMPVKWMSAEIL